MRTSSTPHRCAYSILIVEESQSTPGYATLEPAGYSTDDLSAAKAWVKAFNRRELEEPVRAWAVIATEPVQSSPRLTADVLVIEGARPVVPVPRVRMVKFRGITRDLADSFVEGFNDCGDRRPLCAVVAPWHVGEKGGVA
jgi:hypothetical protein